MRLPPSIIALSIACAGAHPSARAEQGLSAESPFLPAPGAGAQANAPAENAVLELRGVLVDKGTILFNIFNATTKKSQWLALKEAGGEVVVKSHELVEERDTVTVEHQGRTLRLALAKPKTNSSGKPQAPQPAPQPLPAVAGVQPKPAEGPVFQPVLNPTSADEARRLEAVAAEVRRRRALRQEPGSTPQQNAP